MRAMHWHVEEWCDGQLSIHELDLTTGATGDPIAWMEPGPNARANAESMCKFHNEAYDAKRLDIYEAEFCIDCWDPAA